MKLFRFLCFLSILIGTFFLGATFFLFTNHWIDISVLEHYNPGRPSIVLDDEGNEWTRFQLDRRKPVSLDQMPPHLINAFVAAEDWTFFSHYGLSIKCIVRSILKNVYYGRKVQGGSTITQQLVKLLFFDSEKTWTRKLKEQLYALIIEQQFTKEQILEIYLNHVYFGCGIYGVEAASKRFWGKSVSDLTIDQAASLAAVWFIPCPAFVAITVARLRRPVLDRSSSISATRWRRSWNRSAATRRSFRRPRNMSWKRSARWPSNRVSWPAMPPASCSSARECFAPAT